MTRRQPPIPDVYDVAIEAIGTADPLDHYRARLAWAVEEVGRTAGRRRLDLRVLIVRLEGAVAAESVRVKQAEVM